MTLNSAAANVVDLLHGGSSWSPSSLSAAAAIEAIPALPAVAVAAALGTRRIGAALHALRLRLLTLLLPLLLTLGVLTVALGLFGLELFGQFGILLQQGFPAAEADALGFGVDLEHLAAHNVAHLELILHLRNAAHAKMRNVDEAVDGAFPAPRTRQGTMRTTCPPEEPTGVFAVGQSPGLGLQLPYSPGNALFSHIDVRISTSIS